VARKLKVYRTPIGFHDAYVAAPSQKAALEAWGSDHDLFGRGVAETVDDPALTREPLAHPGTVIRRLRGTADEQIAALPPDRPARTQEHAPKRAKRSPAKSGRKPVPKPDRSALDDAQRALEEAEARHRRDRDDIARREAELVKERRALEKAQAAEADALQKRIDAAEAAYQQAMRKWRE
jgi:hypothetical protein